MRMRNGSYSVSRLEGREPTDYCALYGHPPAPLLPSARCDERRIRSTTTFFPRVYFMRTYGIDAMCVGCALSVAFRPAFQYVCDPLCPREVRGAVCLASALLGTCLLLR
eukprot:scaffold1570_cov131-Isochrysis_galbana.AAC.2